MSLYKTYCLNLKKDLRLFEEAIDEIKYGAEEKEPKKESSSNKENDIDLLGEIEINNDSNSTENKDVNFLDLEVESNPVELQNQTPQNQTFESPQPIQFGNTIQNRPEAFDFLGDKPSAEDFIKLLK